jgi:putative FmdB family regulatory protein
MQKEPCEGLQMAATKRPTRLERRHLEIGLRIPHTLILNRDGSFALLSRRRSFVMPIFEYICQECEHHFEALVYGKEKASCPKCESKKLAPQLSVFAVSAKGASGSPSPRAAGPCGSCGDPRGPGACSLGDMN